MAAHRHKYKALDLFCGCGGLSLGLRRAGFTVLAAIDNDTLSTSTYKLNHKRTHLVGEDIKLVDPAKLMKKMGLKPGELDLMAGCPPCQGFSALRTLNGGRDIHEPLNDLVYEFRRFIEVFMPKTVMMENVPALLNDDRLQHIRREFEGLGYSTAAELFNAERFGVPQRRLRMILFASRDDCPPFARPVRGRRTVSGAIRKLPLPEESNDPLHGYFVRRTENVMSLIRRIPKDGGSRTDLPDTDQLPCHQRLNGFKDVYGRMAWNKPAPTLTGGCINPSKGRYLHPTEDRAITLREAALLQGFPMRYEFDMSKGRYPTAKLIGNAFPPKFAEHHARAIYAHLESQSEISR
ncbi:MAG: DNA cytosine methyltransferase [Rhodobacteraceae bacterium]|nr:DNA cytosine methyltransferase [Paracoccaceae bacterium]